MCPDRLPQVQRHRTSHGMQARRLRQSYVNPDANDLSHHNRPTARWPLCDTLCVQRTPTCTPGAIKRSAGRRAARAQRLCHWHAGMLACARTHARICTALCCADEPCLLHESALHKHMGLPPPCPINALRACGTAGRCNGLCRLNCAQLWNGWAADGSDSYQNYTLWVGGGSPVGCQVACSLVGWILDEGGMPLAVGI